MWKLTGAFLFDTKKVRVPRVVADKDAVNELSASEAHKLPAWLRVVFNLWRIIMWTNLSEIAFNDGAFKDWVENEEWSDIKESSKTKWLHQRVVILRNNEWTEGVLTYLQDQASKLAVGAPIPIPDGATLIEVVLAELALLFLRTSKSLKVTVSTKVSTQVAFLAAKKGELLELIKEGEEAFDASGSSIVTLLLKSAGDMVRETAPKRAKKKDCEEEEAPPAKAKAVDAPPQDAAPVMNPLSGHPMQLGSLKNPARMDARGTGTTRPIALRKRATDSASAAEGRGTSSRSAPPR